MDPFRFHRAPQPRWWLVPIVFLLLPVTEETDLPFISTVRAEYLG